MSPETKAFAPFEVKSVDTSARTFEGLASTWDLDLGGDVIHKGAYARTLDHWRKSNGRRVIPLIDQHRYDSVRSVFGKMVEAEEQDAGLYTRWEVVDSEDGNEYLARVAGGYVTGLSIGYSVIPGATERVDGVRHIRELKLLEVSAVIWGMNPGALIDATSVKSLADAIRTQLTEEQKAEIRALLTEPAPEPDAVGLAPERAEALRQRLLSIKLQRLATRARAARHA